MKKIILAIAAFVGATCIGMAQDCNINLCVVDAQQTEDVPDATIDFLNARLVQIANIDGIATDPLQSQFFLTGKFNHIVEDVVAGPPMQTALQTQLTLYIGDVHSKTTYSSITLDLRGVGTSDQRAFINALKLVNAKNSQIQQFLNKGRQKIVNYYNNNYPQILRQAEQAAALHKYDEALWHLVSVPECCEGYNSVKAYIDEYFTQYINREGTRLLTAAKAAWSTHPDQSGAQKAFSFLVQIDPESIAYPDALALTDEIQQSVQSDREFELRKKYNDKIELERSRIEGARAVGVAFGEGQQPTTTNITWLR